MLVRAGGGAVHADLPDDLAHRIRAGLRLRQNPVPRAIAPPAGEPVSAGLPRPVAFGQITPLRAALLIGGQQRSNDTPDMIGQLASSGYVLFS